MRAFDLFATFVRANFQRDVAYRADFFAQFAVSLLQLGMELVTAYVIFYRAQSLAGWTYYQVLALLGVYHMISGFIAAFVAPNMRLLMEDVRQGTFDFVLLKPVSSQFLASIRQLTLWRLADILLGAALALYAMGKLGGGIGPAQAGQFVVMLLAGAAIVYAFWLMLATLCFWVVRVDNIEMIFWNLFEAGRYPLDVYPAWIQRALTVVIPLAFITTIPARALIGTLTPHWLLTALLVAAVMLVVSSLFWRVALRRYSSASS